MNKFEAVLILSPEISTSVLDGEIKKFKELITNASGKIINDEDWGLRELSYNINKFKKAFYNFFQLEINGDEINQFKNELNQNDKILRYLFIKVKDHQELPTKLANEKK